MLKRIANDVWAQEGELSLFGGALPCRATILRLADGGLVVHSPIALDDATAEEIAALGDVRYLVAPNTYHWMFLAGAKERFPNARVLGVEGLGKKLGGLAFDRLPDHGALDGAPELRVACVRGAPAMNEHVVLHEPSRSLLVSDLLFNVHEPRSLATRLFLRLGGALNRPAQSRLWRLLVKDRRAAGESAAELLAWEFDRVVVAHGTIIERDAREVASHALAWMAGGAPSAQG